MRSEFTKTSVEELEHQGISVAMAAQYSFTGGVDLEASAGMSYERDQASKFEQARSSVRSAFTGHSGIINAKGQVDVRDPWEINPRGCATHPFAMPWLPGLQSKYQAHGLCMG